MSINRIYIWGFVGTLGLFGLMFFLLPKHAFSELENRPLQQAPTLNWDHILSKRFAEDTETYLSDHFPLRDKWVSAKSFLEQLRLQKENNGIYLGKDGYLFEKFNEPDWAQVKAYTDALNQFVTVHSDANISLLLAPNAIGMYPERLPALAPAYSQREVNEEIGEQLNEALLYLNGFDILSPAAYDTEPIYYRTDHHWTTYGAYLAYQAYAQAMGWEPLPQEAFNIEIVSDTFLGSYHTKGQFRGVKPDYIQKYTPIVPVSSEIYIRDTDTVANSLYDEEFLNKKDQYAFFQGGVHAVMQVTSKLAATEADIDKLLIIKDSYAHSMLPFLVHHAKEIHMLDIRFYNGSFSSYMKDNGITDALLLFNTATFVEERSLLKLKY
ncbi:DHHW family protein [Paenibacillus chungangensis]|uniref:DHHW family protein n=1 Tax=Paenibacillus chungangensis TaxID=696535 RepID=A0ABW3HSE3_9BACL